MLPLALHQSVEAQTANQYTTAFTTGASLVTQTSPTTLTSAPNDDNVTSTAQAIGFNFSYETIAYTHFVVTPDGLLKLLTSSSGTGANEPTNSITSTTNQPKLMPFWDDMALGSTGGYVRYSLEGSSPNRRAVIEWNVTIPKSTSTAANTKYQVVLNENGNTIEYIYSGTAGSGTLSASVGLGGATATNYLSVTTSSNTTSSTSANNAIAAFPASGYKITFTPPVLCSGTPTAGTVTASAAAVCTGYTTTLTLAGQTTFVGAGIQWQVSTDHVTFTDISGATNTTYVASPTASQTWYRARVTCSFSSLFAYSNTFQVDIVNPVVSAPATLPFVENFENWINSCATGDRPSAFWINTPTTGNQSWRREDNGAAANWTNPNTGIYAPVASLGAHSARFHSAGTTSGQLGTLDVYLNFSASGSKVISFDYINTSGTDSLIVEVSTNGGSTFNRIGGLRTALLWTPVSFISNDVASIAIVRLRGKSDAGSTDIGVDNMRVFASSCLPPTALTETSITPNGVNIGGTVTGTPIAYQVQYGSTSFIAGTGTNAFGTSLPVSLTGLAGGTSYSYFVRSICSAGDTSAWSVRDTFTTSCGTYNLPFLETFDTYLPTTCWTEATGFLNTGSTLTAANSAWTGANYLNGSSNPAAVVQLTSNTRRDWLISPSIVLGTPAAGTNFAMELNIGIVNNGASTPATMGSDDTLAVVISTDDGATWSRSNIVKVFTAANTPINATTGAQKYVIPLAGYTGTIRVGFYGSEGVVDDAPNFQAFVDSVRIYSCTIPTVNVGIDSVLCSGTTRVINAGNAGSTYLWSTNATTQTISVTTAGTYSVVVTSPAGCMGSDAILLTASTTPVVALGNDTTFCPGTGVLLNAGNAGSSYLWSNSATTQTITATTAGNYNVRVTNPDGCFARDTVVIAAAPNPVVALGNDTAICPGSTLNLNAANAGASYLWNGGATTQILPVTVAGTYSVRVTSTAKCVGRDTIVVTIAPVPTVFLGNDTTRCPGATITLNAGNAGASYLWSNSATTQSINVTASGTYSVSVTNSFKCVGTDAINILPGVNPSVNLGPDAVLCPGNTQVLSAGNAGATYLWSPNTGAVTSQTYTATGPGKYYVIVTNATKCSSTDTIVLTGGTTPVVSLGNDTVLCPAATIVLDAKNAGASYLWNTGATTQSIAVTIASNYNVRVTNTDGCIGIGSIRIFAGTNPVVNLGPDTTICKNISSLILNAGNPGLTYAWSTGQTTQTLDVAPFVNTTGVPGSFVSVYVVVTNANKCQASDAKVLNIVPVASVSTINKVQSGLGVQLSSDALNANYYLWEFGDGVTSNDSMPTHYYPASGTYNVRVIVGNACYYDTAYITLNISNVGTGTLNAGNSAVRLYPNPSQGQVTVEYEGAGGINAVSVVNAVGAVVYKETFKQARKEMVNLSELPAGSYLIRVQTREGWQTQRLQLTK